MIEEEEKAIVLNKLAVSYQEINPKTMLTYSQKALSVSNKTKNQLIIGQSYQNIGTATIILGEYSKALENLISAKNVFENAIYHSHSTSKKELKNGLARAYGSMGVVFSEQSNYSKALIYYLKAIKIYREISNWENNARLYNNVGIVYLSQGKQSDALNYFFKCLKIQEEIKDPTIGITITNIGNIYNEQGKFERAIFHYKKALRLFKKYPNSRGLGELYNNIGLYYKRTNNEPKAIENYLKAIQVFNSINDKFGISDTYYYLGEIYFEKHDYQKAIDFMQKSLKLSKELGVLEQIKNAENKLYLMFNHLQQPQKALEHFIAYSKAKDSILNHENIRNTIRAEFDFEFDKKELFHKKEQEKKELIYHEKIKRNEQKLIFIGCFIVLISTFILLLYKRFQTNKTLRLKLALVEYEQKALHLQMNPHFVFNCLGSISSFILQNNIDEAIKYLSKFSKLMRLTLEFSKEPLIPIHKEIESLENYLELEILRFNNLFSYKITKSDDVEDDIALPSLLLQPFVENAIIHGVVPKNGGGQIAITFDVDQNHIICTIQDNGVGIYTSQSAKEKLVNLHKSMALDITKNRLKMMETLTFQPTRIDILELKNESNEVIGTKVTLQLPIQYIV